ncbi:hypothetical protein ACLOJK_001299 [Asimina triloba]
MKSPSGTINIAASAQRLGVDNRISLKYYYRIADNLLRQPAADYYVLNCSFSAFGYFDLSLVGINDFVQADIYREEKNIIDLYIMLLRICFERHICKCCQTNGKLLNAMTELEALKPAVQSLIEELNRKRTRRVHRSHQVHQNLPVESSLEWPPVKSPIQANCEIRQVQQSIGSVARSQNSWIWQDKFSNFPAISLSIPRPKEETLLRHSILGPGGLHGRWQPPTIDTKVRYPTNIDSTPAEIPSLIQLAEDESIPAKDGVNLEPERSRLESVLSLDDGRWSVAADEPRPVTTSDTVVASNQIDIIRQPSPPSVLADVQDLVPANSSQVIDLRSEPAKSLQDEFIHSESPLQLHISTGLMDSFMEMAKSNTKRDLETCGLLKNRKFFITALIIPKQESTANTIMLPEAIAIVMAPTDSSRKHGIFRLTTPGGMSVIRQCQQRGFHHHNDPPEGGPIYDSCTDVYMNPSLKFDVIDLR